MLDVDSTLSALEGIDWLAERRGADVSAHVARLTREAMDGRAMLDTVYAERLAMVAPTRDDMAALGEAYVAALVPGAREAIATWQAAGVRVVLVSGGLRPGIVPLARAVGVPEADLHAADLDFTPDGRFAAVDATQPLATPLGKAQVLRVLALPRPILVVGDGSTDAEARREADAFCAFTGVVHRAAVIARADHVADSFAAVTRLVLPA